MKNDSLSTKIKVLIDPIVGVMYYLNKYFHKNNRNGNNVIMVGFYIEQ